MRAPSGENATNRTEPVWPTGNNIRPSVYRPHVPADRRVLLWTSPYSMQTQHSFAADEIEASRQLEIYEGLLVSTAEGTRVSYGAGLLRFHQYCDRHDVSEHRRMPASPILISAFIADAGATQQHLLPDRGGQRERSRERSVCVQHAGAMRQHLLPDRRGQRERLISVQRAAVKNTPHIICLDDGRLRREVVLELEARPSAIAHFSDGLGKTACPGFFFQLGGDVVCYPAVAGGNRLVFLLPLLKVVYELCYALPGTLIW
ncbi:hypothetical protein B0H14DRAFT_3605433 [Mycena olivaceomarginata]|nr:hypothetical protein B0H14DRAFT_3605433 [Mycena olivaceomarginata]